MKNLLINKLNKDKEKFQICQKGIVKKRKSSMNFNFSDTPPPTPQEQDDYWCDVEQNQFGTPATPSSGPLAQPASLLDYDQDFSPLSRQPIINKTPEPRGTSFLYPKGSISPLRDKLPNIAPLPSRPSVDNFSRPVTKMTDEKNNTISITPKKQFLSKQGKDNYLNNYKEFFSILMKQLKKNQKTLKKELVIQTK